MTDAGDIELWRRIADSVTDAVWVVDPDLRILALNAAAERLAGVRTDQVLGHDLRATAPTLAGSDREAAMLRVAAGGGAESLRLWHPGFGAWVELAIAPDPRGILIRVHVVTAAVQAERQARLDAAILDSVGEGIYGVDAGNRITFVNAAARRLLGYDATTLLGANSHEMLHHSRSDHSPMPESECPLLATLRDGEPRECEDVLWRADDTPLLVRYHATAIEEDTRIVGAVVSFRDLTSEIAASEAERAAAAAAGALHELQQVLQPPPPGIEDPCLGVYYLPADAAAAGGDLYDWQSMPDDGLHIAVVDVIGKGLIAARDALAVTHAIKLLVLAHTPLEQVARQASWLLADAYPNLAASALIAHYESGSGRLRFVSAGHPPPLYVTPDGDTTFLEASGRPLGWPDAGTDDVVELQMPPGSRVLLYTDGLIEGTRDILAGMDALAGLAREVRDMTPADAARTLVTRTLTDAARRDDCLAIVLERPQP